MFIKVGLRDFPSAALVDARLLLAAIVLVGVVLARGGPASLRPAARPGAFVGTVGMALPFLLITWGATHLGSGLAAGVHSSPPCLFAILDARVPGSRPSNCMRR